MIRYIVFFLLYLDNPWKKPAKTRTRLLRVRVLRGKNLPTWTRTPGTLTRDPGGF